MIEMKHEFMILLVGDKTLFSLFYLQTSELSGVSVVKHTFELFKFQCIFDGSENWKYACTKPVKKK